MRFEHMVPMMLVAVVACAGIAGATTPSIVLHGISGPQGCGYERPHNNDCENLTPQGTVGEGARECVDVYLKGTTGAKVAQLGLRFGDGWEYLGWTNGNVHGDVTFTTTQGRDLLICAALDSSGADTMSWVGTVECVTGGAGTALTPVVAELPSGSAFVSAAGQVVTFDENGFQGLTVGSGNIAGCDGLDKSYRNGTGANSGQDAGLIMRRSIPNPLRSGSLIEWSAKAAPITMEVYDVGGRLVRVIQDDGRHGGLRAVWDGRTGRGDAMGTGMYLLRITQGGSSWTCKALYIR